MSDAPSRHEGQNPLVKVCALMNKHAAHYLIIGGHACILHGLVHTTEDVDILIEDSAENCRKVIAALSDLADHAAAELTPADFRDNVVVKVADEVEVDVSRCAWKVSYAEAAGSALTTEIDGVIIPYIGLKALMASKETYRERDQTDLLFLRRLWARQAGKP